MLTIGIICLFALVTCDEYGVEYDDYSPTQYEYEGDSESGSGSGDDTTTTTPAPSEDVGGEGGGGGKGWAIFGGIVGGLSALAGLAVLGRRFCKKSRHEKDDKDLDYDYYSIIQRRTSSSYV